MEFQHETVLLHEAVKGLNIKSNGVYVDCTLGGAGHSSLILEHLDENGHLYAFDQDDFALQEAGKRLQTGIDNGQVTLIKSNFRNLQTSLEELGVHKVDGVLYDLGVSSPQLDDEIGRAHV